MKQTNKLKIVKERKIYSSCQHCDKKDHPPFRCSRD